MPFYVAGIFLSAYLLFLVQPILAKTILPWFGGSPSVWTTCMLFFQVVLLLGYAYAHGSVARLGARAQAAVHVALVGATLLFLPIIPNPLWKPAGDEEPSFRILGLLAATVGLPYFLVSSNSPLVQAWYARAFPGRSPYRLFALSNAASMLALLSYPTVIEPLVATSRQAQLWSVGYAAFALVTCVLAIWNARVAALAPAGAPAVAPAAETDPPPATAAAAPPTFEMRLLWLALPAAASALMLAITNQMCQEIAAIPFLWLLPFTLYLLSFILCFESDRWYRRSRYMIALALAFVGLYYALTQMHALRPSVGIALYSAGLFVCCMFCHGELAHLKPPARHLTSFYLMCALGGALGGVFVALVAPRIFKLFFEVQGAMLVCALLAAPDVTGRYHGPVRRQGRALRLAAMVAFIVVLLSVQMYYSTQSARVLVRNFYGTLRVDEVDAEAGGGRLRKMVHGTTIHGQEYVAPPQPHRPLGYFGPGSGIHLALTQLRPDAPRRVGILGLGVGTLAAYGRPGDVYRFYEINPLVIDLAQREFDYLGACRAKVELLLGDARLVLERERPQAYDVLVADAFSSDSIPLHLVTRESFALYLSHLKPDGLLACNISNRYLDMRPVLVQLARAHGLTARYIFDEGDPAQGTMSSTWVLLARDGGFFARPEVKRVALPLDDVRQDLRLWTDDYSNLFQILR